LKVVLSIGYVETNGDHRQFKNVKIKTGKVLVTPKG
jgi:hypothetical protein